MKYPLNGEDLEFGVATGIRNYSLQRTVADDRARGDLAKVFEVYMTSLTKDYQAHTTAVQEKFRIPVLEE